ncbi:uncharacterized protein LALA0_S06e00606g [Lachancea lanzarotensis]|uniref:LALA0S06e00606g1_1 n=1 Tax=Lachancea lanzarotensis TaxID=1245769 RepID=A0A0C7N7X8_9SACH|nr:uncharacterized protein LALA0_S06e00606g [Lachancea lanzarotensis]CEP62653.1 LALA0S06e00606g1_1 [Lachancea lanzarotensis]
MILDLGFRGGKVPQLPVELFSSKLSWKLHDLAKAKKYYVWLFALAIFPVVTLSILKKTGTWSSWITKFVVLLSAEIVLASLPFACQFKKLNRIPKLLRPLLIKEVVELGLDFRHENWNMIAKRANEFLLQEGFWHSELCIYDGEECLRYFRGQVYLPYVNVPSESREEQLAARIYEKSYEDYWNSQKLAKITTAEEPCQNLPKDTYHFSFVYDLVYGGKKALKYLPVVVLTYLLLNFKISPKLIVTASVIGFLQLMCFSYPLTRQGRKTVLSRPVHVLTLMKLKLHLEPGESASEWDKVAKKMNTYLNEEGILRDRTVFFDGRECHEKFKSLLASILADGDIKRNMYPELIRFAIECKTA